MNGTVSSGTTTWGRCVEIRTVASILLHLMFL